MIAGELWQGDPYTWEPTKFNLDKNLELEIVELIDALVNGDFNKISEKTGMTDSTEKILTLDSLSMETHRPSLLHFHRKNRYLRAQGQLWLSY